MTWRRNSLASIASAIFVAGLVVLIHPLAVSGQDNPSTPAASPATTSAPAGTTAGIFGRPQVTEDQVTHALRGGVDYLLSVKKNENWEAPEITTADQHYGMSCLVLYALLHVGESLEDPRLKPRSEQLAGAVRYVLAMEPETVYAAGLQANVLSLLPRRPETLKLLDRRKEQLLNAAWPDGGHSYYLDPKRLMRNIQPASDGSNSQYALLGLWAAEDAGILVPQTFWASADKYWRSRARPDGGFPYYGDTGVGGPFSESSLSMTAAGVASLYVAGDAINRTATTKPREDRNLDAAMTYLADKFKPMNMNGYELYSVERVGLASGRKYIGTADWFVEGAAALIEKQDKKKGYWRFKENDRVEVEKVSTAFGLLFLARGRNPVIMNKLKYPGEWNARPRDTAYFAEWMSRQAERQINWQVVSLETHPDEWRDAPLLLIEGGKDPEFTPQQIAKLKRYVREGGLIFSSADSNSREFTNAMQRYAQIIAEGTAHKWRELPKDHLVYNVYQKMSPETAPPLMGLSNGLRELWIHSPADLGAAWQARLHPNPGDKRAGNLAKERPWEIAANVFFYANGRGGFRSKLQTSVVAETGVRPVRTIKVGRLSYNGNWDPEPGAFERLSRIAYNRWKTDLQFVPVDFQSLKNVPIVYMCGVGQPDIGVKDRWALRDYLRGGGILIADAANSSKEFDAWMQEAVKELFPGDKWDVLDDRSVLYAAQTAPDMTDIRATSLRHTTQQELGAQTKPRIHCLISRVDPRVRILYSPIDLTTGYLGTTTTTFTGYSPDSAELLARNMILYSNAVVRSTPKK